MSKVKYINPYTDFGFKKLFGEEGNKDLLIDFLNQLLPPHPQIAELSFRNPENLPDSPEGRKAIYKNLQLKFLQMPLFTKQEHELETRFDKWCYFLKNLQNFDHIPAILNEPIFQKAFKTAELANMTAEQRDRYDQSLINYWDMKNMVDTAVEEERIEIAKRLIASGSTNEFITQITELSVEQIEKLRTFISPS